MPQRQYSKQQSKVAKTNPRVILPATNAEYNECASVPHQFRQWLDIMIEQHPELFPQQIEQGYTLHDRLPESAKLPDVCFRRIKLKADVPVRVFTICASDVMPYMTGFTTEVEKALFLRRFGVPFWALTYVFGHNDAYWYRQAATFGRYEIVSTVVKDPACLPDDLLADEKHTRFNGEKGYIATTVGKECIFGASLAMEAARYFHGNWRSAELQIRSWTLFHNFLPYCPRAGIRERFVLPAHQLTGSLYHDNWRQNLLISTSCAGFSTNHRKR